MSNGTRVILREIVDACRLLRLPQRTLCTRADVPFSTFRTWLGGVPMDLDRVERVLAVLRAAAEAAGIELQLPALEELPGRFVRKLVA